MITTDITEENALKNTVPAIILDYCFLEGFARRAPGQESEHEGVMKTKVMTEHRSGARLVRNAKTKGIGDGKKIKIMHKWL